MKKQLILCAMVFSFGANASGDGQAEKPKPFDIGACYGAMWADERAAIVKTRLGLGQNPIPLAIRASKDKASAKEKQSLSFVSDAMQTCQELHKPSRANYHPIGAQITSDFERATIATLARVYARDITWGEAVEENAKNNAEFDRRVTEFNSAMLAAQQAKEQQQAAQKAQAEAMEDAQRAADAERRYQQSRLEQMEKQQMEAKQQQQFMNGLMLLNAARPGAAPLQRPDFGVNCQSRTWGSTVYTNCN